MQLAIQNTEDNDSDSGEANEEDSWPSEEPLTEKELSEMRENLCETADVVEVSGLVKGWRVKWGSVKL